ncbi:uncharacterized protein LOC143146145 [Ptiloglossa arizonensis]|uniref:uncharacterized protein LOC143146145 n=1 Tax=Ptiloglossa arizonensis TaxID=3350558 RepID=UPI003FA076BD
MGLIILTEPLDKRFVESEWKAWKRRSKSRRENIKLLCPLSLQPLLPVCVLAGTIGFPSLSPHPRPCHSRGELGILVHSDGYTKLGRPLSTFDDCESNERNSIRGFGFPARGMLDSARLPINRTTRIYSTSWLIIHDYNFGHDCRTHDPINLSNFTGTGRGSYSPCKKTKGAVYHRRHANRLIAHFNNVPEPVVLLRNK